MATSLTSRCLTAAAPVPRLTRVRKVLKAAMNTAPVVKPVINPLLVTKTVVPPMPWP